MIVVSETWLRSREPARAGQHSTAEHLTERHSTAPHPHFRAQHGLTPPPPPINPPPSQSPPGYPPPPPGPQKFQIIKHPPLYLRTEHTEQALRLIEISQPTDTQSFGSQLPEEEEELELEAGFMRLAGRWWLVQTTWRETGNRTQGNFTIGPSSPPPPLLLLSPSSGPRERLSCGAQKGKPDSKTDSDSDSGSSLTSCSADCVSSEVKYSPDDISCD